MEKPFWQTKSLAQMNREEWESLCDGCGRCCLHKLEYAGEGRVEYTNIACRLLDIGSCRCMDYDNRRAFVPDCRSLTPETVRTTAWLPPSCAYRLLDEGLIAAARADCGHGHLPIGRPRRRRDDDTPVPGAGGWAAYTLPARSRSRSRRLSSGRPPYSPSEPSARTTRCTGTTIENAV